MITFFVGALLSLSLGAEDVSVKPTEFEFYVSRLTNTEITQIRKKINEYIKILEKRISVVPKKPTESDIMLANVRGQAEGRQEPNVIYQARIIVFEWEEYNSAKAELAKLLSETKQ